MKNLFKIFLPALFSVQLSAQTVWDVIVNSPNHTTLETAVLAAGLDGALSGPGPLTVFAPDDAAFAALPSEVLNAALADPQGLLTNVLLYHVVGAQALSTDLSDGQLIPTLLGQNVSVNLNGGVFINSSQVVAADLTASNGVVHVIDAVLLPTFPSPTTVWDVIVNSEAHATLETAVLLAGLDGALSGDGPFTVFAPTDDAFAALPSEVLNAALADPSGLLTNVLLYHVVGAQALSTDLSDGQTVTTLFGQDVLVTINMNGVFINNAQVTVADITTDNGVVHVIDAVLLPTFPEPVTVLDIIVNSPEHTLLETAIFSANLEGTLSGDGPFTVFAPTDAAFNNLAADVLNAVLNDPEGLLTQVLLYHVVSGQALSTDLSDGQVISTVLGQDIVVTINGNGVFINDAQVTVADLVADNGVVHVIDAVLIPSFPEPVTVWDVIVNSDVHATLETAVLLAGLDGALSGAGPLTVFAPTDAAFAALPAEVLNAVLADPTGQLTDILLYHVVAAEALSSSLSNGQNIITLNGQTITVSIVSGNVFINNAQVVVADIQTDNGVVHVIDAVLLPAPPQPASVWEIIVNSPNHTILEQAVLAAGLDGALSGNGPLTVFAPTDAAFGLIPANVLAEILADPTGALTNILTYHVVGAQALSSSLSNGQSIATLQGQNVNVSITGGGMVMINNANVIAADLLAQNGVVHVIDAVLIPSTDISQVETAVQAVFPNPTAGLLNVNFASDMNGAQFQIFNLQGQKVKEGRFGGMNNVISVNELSSGHYALRLIAEGFDRSILFVKE